MYSRMQFRAFISFLVVFTLVFNNVALAQSDQQAPKISSVQVSDVSETSVTVTWQTDENADSLVNYGLQADYGILRKPIAERKTHSMTLEDLEPGRVYYFRVVSADADGNQGISADYRVQTTGNLAGQEGSGAGQEPEAGQGQGVSPETGQGNLGQSFTTNKVIEQINQITSPQQLQEILNETIKAIEGITEDLTIVGPPTVIPETTTAVVKWTTDRESSSEVVFSPTNSFDGTNYQFSQSSTGGVAPSGVAAQFEA